MPLVLTRILAASMCLPANAASPSPDPEPGPGAKHVACDLVLPREQLAADTTTTIGVRFRIAPGWHLYWNGQNDSGAAPTIDFAGSDPRLAFGPAAWPVPVRHAAEGDIVDHVYEGECLLLVPMTVAKGVEGALPIRFRSDLLVCSEACLPGRVHTTINVGAGPAAGPPGAGAAVLERATGAMAREMQGPVPFAARLESRTLFVEPRQGQQLRRLTFMPGPGCEATTLAPDCESRVDKGGTPRLEIKLNSPGASGIVQCEDDTGQVTNWRLDLRDAGVSEADARNHGSSEGGATSK
ncbi:MAG: protein-disulfide reductase DsbD N-terminal domain-containing protein [Phycisphaerae bacterium]